jgi:hypothetical protein
MAMSEKYVIVREDKHHYLMTNEIHWTHNIHNCKVYDYEEALDKVDELSSQLDCEVYASPLSVEYERYRRVYG